MLIEFGEGLHYDELTSTPYDREQFIVAIAGQLVSQGTITFNAHQTQPIVVVYDMQSGDVHMKEQAVGDVTITGSAFAKPAELVQEAVGLAAKRHCLQRLQQVPGLEASIKARLPAADALVQLNVHQVETILRQLQKIGSGHGLFQRKPSDMQLGLAKALGDIGKMTNLNQVDRAISDFTKTLSTSMAAHPTMGS